MPMLLIAGASSNVSKYSIFAGFPAIISSNAFPFSAAVTGSLYFLVKNFIELRFLQFLKAKSSISEMLSVNTIDLRLGSSAKAPIGIIDTPKPMRMTCSAAQDTKEYLSICVTVSGMEISVTSEHPINAEELIRVTIEGTDTMESSPRYFVKMPLEIANCEGS